MDLAGVKSETPYYFPGGERGPLLFYLFSNTGKSHYSSDILIASVFDLNDCCFLQRSEEAIIKAFIPRDYHGCRLINAIDNRIIIESPDASKGIHIVDPFSSSSSWTLHARLPPSPPYQRRVSNPMRKIAMIGDLAVGIPCSGTGLRCTTTKMHGWIPLDRQEIWCRGFIDIVSYGGLFYAVIRGGSKVKSISFPSSYSSQSPPRLSKVALVEDAVVEDVGLEPEFDPSDEECHGWSCCRDGRLVSSPNGALFFVRWRQLWNAGGTKKRRDVNVYKLLGKKWVPVLNSLDNCSIFLGPTHSIALTPCHFPNMKTNRIFLPCDATSPLSGPILDDEDVTPDYTETLLVYNFEDKTCDALSGENPMHELGIRSNAVWMIPPQVI